MNRVRTPSVQTSEALLIEQAAGGDRAACRELFELHRDAAYQVAFRVTGRNEDALDVVQDSFIRAFDRLGEFQRESGFRTWLLRIVTNRSLDLLRARRVRLAVSLDGDADSRPDPPAANEGQGVGDELERRELGDRVQRAIDALPPDQRIVFSLFASAEMTYGQIAEVVGIPIGTVMSRLFHARRKLQEMLADVAK